MHVLQFRTKMCRGGTNCDVRGGALSMCIAWAREVSEYNVLVGGGS